MSRSYKGIQAHKPRVYASEDVLRLYDIGSNTLSNWVKQGLQPIEGTRPHLFRGAELCRFHAERRMHNQRTLRAGEFKCVTCKLAVLPAPAGFWFSLSSHNIRMAHGTCPECSGRVLKLLNETEYDSLRQMRNPNTSLDCGGEEITPFPAGIGISAADRGTWNAANERVIYAWQGFAGKYDEKTVKVHLAAIRQFEAFSGLKPFDKLTNKDADLYRAHLILRCKTGTGSQALSRSTARHQAAYLRLFFAWLSKEKGFKHLASLPEYFTLPRALATRESHDQEKAYLSLEEAQQALAALPARSILDRRDRAIFALAYATGLRENALITLRLKHIDPAKRQVLHDGRELRAKNGKTFTVKFFPRTEGFADVVLAWITELQQLGLQDADALFPDARTLTKPHLLGAPGRDPVPVMRTPNAVDAVFKRASGLIKRSFTPHSARHTLAQLGEMVCHSAAQRKAWSLNFGHSKEETTWGYYGKMSGAQKDDILENICEGKELTHDEMRLVLAYYCRASIPGTLEFERGWAIAQRIEQAEHKKRKNGG